MGNLKNEVMLALLEHVKKDSDPFATEVIKIYEEIEHALLADTGNYGAEDRYYVRIIYRRNDYRTETYIYDGTFGQLMIELTKKPR